MNLFVAGPTQYLVAFSVIIFNSIGLLEVAKSMSEVESAYLTCLLVILTQGYLIYSMQIFDNLNNENQSQINRNLASQI